MKKHVFFICKSMFLTSMICTGNWHGSCRFDPAHQLKELELQRETKWEKLNKYCYVKKETKNAETDGYGKYMSVVSENYNRSNKKFDFELMLKRRAKTYSSSCSQTVSLSPAIISQFILGVCAAAKDRKKSIKIPNFESSASFKVIDVDTTEKFVTSACCDRQHAHAYLQPFSRNTGQQR